MKTPAPRSPKEGVDGVWPDGYGLRMSEIRKMEVCANQHIADIVIELVVRCGR